MLDALVDRQDGYISGSSQSSMIEKILKTAQNGNRPVAIQPDPVYKIGSRQMQVILSNGFALVIEEIAGFISKQLLYCSNRS
jgi:hypothetical protein